jgi:signal transduction histidine kinase
VLNSLSGRFLILTTVFVMLAEVLIFVPSIARFREDYLLDRLERAQIASLALLASQDTMVAPELEQELLENAGVMTVVLRRDQVRELVLASPMARAISRQFDLRDATAGELIRDAIVQLFDTENRAILVTGTPVQMAGEVIEISVETGPLRDAMIDYGLRILVLSAVISIITAGLLFLAVRRFLVTPMARVVEHMSDYADAPEDPDQVIMPTSGLRELRAAEDALHKLQIQLTGALKQKERLAQLGTAVAKISHDLRNILTTAQLFADRMEMSDDPKVVRAAPKLVGAITRAVNLCEASLAFGKAEEPAPALTIVKLAPLVEDALDGERLAAADNDLVSYRTNIPINMDVRADPEQLYRVITNIVRNARQAIEASKKEGVISILADATEDHWNMRIQDDGPGLPIKAQDNLFTAFQGGVRKGGTGLGLVIAADLIRGHGGKLELTETNENGTVFTISLPRKSEFLVAAAQ